MAQVRFIRGLPGDGLEAFIDQYQSCSSDSPFDTWFILPTERLVQYVRVVLAEKNIPYIPSRICTLESYCRNYFEENRTTTRYLSKAESKILLTQALMENKEQLPLFFSRSHPLPGTLDDLRTFMSVVTTRKVIFPECLLELQSDKSDQIDLIISAYRRHLGDLDLVDSDTIMEWTIDHMAVSDSKASGHIFLYGVLKPLPLEQDLLRVLQEKSKSFRCFIPAGYDPDVFNDPLEWAGNIDTITSFDPSPSYRSQLTGIFSQAEPIDAGGSIRLDTFPSHYTELQGIAAEICRIHDTGVPLSDISVAFPELRQELGIIDEVFSDFGIPWNAKISPRLSQFSVIRFLTGIIGIVANRYTREDVVRLVNSPYFQPGRAPGGSLRLDPDEVDLVSRHALVEGDRRAWLERMDRLSASLSTEAGQKGHGISLHSVERVRDGIRDLFESLQGLEGKKSVQDFIRTYRRILETYGLPYISSDNGSRIQEEQIVHTFLTRLDALSHSTWLFQDRKVSTDEFLRIVNTIVEESDGGVEPDAEGVSVLGIRECAHQHLPYLFICGMVEGAVPRLTTRLPFTNSLENIRMGTRSLADILHEEEYFFITALLSAQKVYLTAPLADGDKPLLTSAFFERVRERCCPDGWKISTEVGISHSQSSSAIRAGELIGTDLVCQAVEWAGNSHPLDYLVNRVNIERYYRTGFCDSPYDGILSGDEQISAALLERYGPEHVYSPTSLETYAQCPFQFFLRNIVGLEDLPEVEPNLSAADRGTAIHDILSTFYRRWLGSGHSKVGLSSMTEALELMQAIVGEELARYAFRSPLWEATCIQMKGGSHTGPGYLERFLIRESEEEESPLVPSCFEFSFGMEIADSDDPASVKEAVELTGSEGSEHLKIRGRIDRIDLSQDGFFLIYDYKTGLQNPRFKDIEAGKALQLPLYLLAFESISGKRGVAAGYYKIRKEVESRMLLCDETGRALIVSRPKVSPDLTGTLGRSRDFALDYIHRIRKGEFPLPHEEKCPNTYCEFRRICRFDPYRIFECEEVT
ncbi:MAG: PD-(D/E)XK nuclease family protein [Methanolinea sp.]|nr:PD-(D/E)XK nuclease family protein [Methanolinea sp.]